MVNYIRFLLYFGGVRKCRICLFSGAKKCGRGMIRHDNAKGAETFFNENASAPESV
jgi:hypothetical protein